MTTVSPFITELRNETKRVMDSEKEYIVQYIIDTIKSDALRDKMLESARNGENYVLFESDFVVKYTFNIDDSEKIKECLKDTFGGCGFIVKYGVKKDNKSFGFLITWPNLYGKYTTLSDDL